ncbi:nucleoside deaminase [Synechococcus sp. PCC 6312]|uniref:nucleoside deaminase n=1 Tax=Synechococcus sp. (strain ATCC 27167 / PCC 6312) TaxID=195253 RepID=UPI00029F1B5B|nr:nucleoside deaminase [Synechococcus sp. PCC 6312]AFY61552.1 cytosine/adenosine deaminase [Synechococcus sp. PCC 6312]
MPQADDEKFMRRAIALSERAALIECTGGPFGSVIVKDGEIIAEGYNHVVAEKDPTWHGEMEAIRKACKVLDTFDLSGCTLYTSAEPCPMCAAASFWARIDRIVFAAHCEDALKYGDFDDTAIYEDLAKPPMERRIPHSEILREESVAVWKRYQEKSDRVQY